jgi:hypothetical protein
MTSKNKNTSENNEKGINPKNAEAYSAQSELINFTKNLNSNSQISSTLKNKIYFWLIDLNILKENAIKVDDIPLLCTNGVLLCDLINRLEGVIRFIFLYLIILEIGDN